MVLTGAATTSARLGSFTSNDGYQHLITPPGATYNWSDVSYYNAGDYGINAGGGSGPTFIAPDSGKWQIVGQVGGFFSNSASRMAEVGSAPPYPTTPPPSGNVASYMVGGHFPGHLGDGRNLAFRNDTPLGTGPSIYEYSLDQYDMGVPPSSVTSGLVDMQFYFLPTLPLPPDPTGAPRGDKFTLSLVDSTGNIGLQWGYGRDNEVLWRDSPSNSWNPTGIYAANQSGTFWDSVKIELDLTGDTFKIDYLDASSVWQNLAPAGTPMGQSMQDFTVLRWQLEDNNNQFFAGKEYFDDFSFSTTIPEPSALVLAGLGAAVLGCAALRRRGR